MGNLKCPTPGLVYVAWTWQWEDHSSSAPFCLSPAPPDHSPSETKSENETEVDKPEVEESKLYIVKFKCIGANKDPNAQSMLRVLAELDNDELRKVDVQLVPEPNNPVDAKAISFVAFHNGTRQRIGYIVREAVDDVHTALKNNQIVKISFDWVKYRIKWVLSGPGYYAAINITKMGKWSPVVYKSASP